MVRCNLSLQYYEALLYYTIVCVAGGMRHATCGRGASSPSLPGRYCGRYEQTEKQLSQWHSEMTQFFTDRLDQFVSQQQQSEQQHETIQETVIETVDSLGRKVRQEQRTISRDVTREMLLTEQRLTRELENRLQCTVDSMDSCWQIRYDSLAARVNVSDSSSVSKTPAGDNRPLMDRIWDKALWFGIGVVMVVLFLIYTKRR